MTFAITSALAQLMSFVLFSMLSNLKAILIIVLACIKVFELNHFRSL
jgi:hypothetical protein